MAAMNFIQVLEGRVLFSASGHAHKVDSPTVAADKAAIAAAQAMIVSDRGGCKATIAADNAAVADAVQTGRTAIAQVKTQIRIDRGNTAALAVDRQQLEAAKATLKANVLTAKTQIKTDNAACKATLATDRVTLVASRKKLKADRRSGA